MMPGPQALFAATEATWPAANRNSVGPFTVREGRGGGSRVSAATLEGAFTDADIAAAQDAMRALGQVPLFMLRGDDAALDAALAARGYAVKDPVTVHAAPVAPLADRARPQMATFEVWPPLATQIEIWAAAGIGPARLAVMDRVRGPKMSILGRTADHPAGTAFVAAAGDIAMIHAIEVAPEFRRQGLAGHMIAAAACWARARGATHLAALVTQANPAAPLYPSLGMAAVGKYHYRIKPE